MLPIALAHSPKLSHSSPPLSLSSESLSDFRLFPHHKLYSSSHNSHHHHHHHHSQPPTNFRSTIMSTVSAEAPSSKKPKIASGGNHRESTPESPENINTITNITGATPPSATPNTDRKPRFQRVFSEEDEIHLLKGFFEIIQDTPNPALAAPMLYERVGKSLSGEINQTQLVEKIRKLRQKYTKQVMENIMPKNPHDKEVFDISNKIWGENPARGRRNSPKGPSNKRVRKRKSSSGGDVPKGGIIVGLPSSSIPPADNNNNDNKAHVADKANYAAEGLNGADAAAAAAVTVAFAPAVKIDLASNYSYLMEEMNRLPGNSIMKHGVKCLDRAELGRFNQNWRLLQIEEAQLSLRRNAMIHEQTKLILEAIAAASKNGN